MLLAVFMTNLIIALVTWAQGFAILAQWYQIYHTFHSTQHDASMVHVFTYIIKNKKVIQVFFSFNST